MKRLHLVLAGLLAASAVALPATAGPAFNNKYSDTETAVECRDSDGNLVGTVTYGGPLKMWPPNHKQQPVTISAVAEDPDDGVSLFTAGTHDEFDEETGEELNGSGNTDNDVEPATADDSGTGSAATAHQLRSERSGRGDGRTYTLDWDATFTDDDGDDGYGTVICGSRDLNEDGEPPLSEEDAFQVTVPHDMRGGADWKKGNALNL